MAEPNANEQVAEAAKAAADAKAQEVAERRTHVKMFKPGEKALYVHPTTVKAHLDAGWMQA